MSEWRPIETAPKTDGFKAIVWLGAPFDRAEMVRWDEVWGVWLDAHAAEPDYIQDEISGIGAEVPTHWQPLPTPPQGDEE